MTTSPSSALLNRGPEAFQELLGGNRDQAVQQLRVLARSELLAVAEVARQLAAESDNLARSIWPELAKPATAGVSVEQVDLLTEAEHRAVQLAGELFKLISTGIVGSARTRQGDIREFSADIHRIQDRVLSQAAARAYPERYRLLGGSRPKKPDETEVDRG